MTTTTQDTTVSESEVNLQRVAKNIQDILEAEGMALQTYMGYGEFGIKPLVRLVNTKENDDTNTNTGEASGDQQETGTASAE